MLIDKIPPKKYQVNFLTFIILVHMERLNLIVVSCGETYVTPEEWACTASIVHTRVKHIDTE